MASDKAQGDKPREWQEVLQLLLPFVWEDRVISSIAAVSQHFRQACKTHVKNNTGKLLAAAIKKLQQHWHEDLSKTGLGWVCGMAKGTAAAEMATHNTAANALQQLQDGVGTQGELVDDRASAVLTLLAQSGLQLTEDLLAACAKHNNLFGRMLPQLLCKHSCLRDEMGVGLTGLELDMEAVALGQQDVQVWQERGRAPADLCKLLCVACYIHDEDQPSSSIFDALLDVDRTGKRLLFTPQESSRYSNSNSGDDGEQAEEQLSPEATLLAELIETAAYHGNTQRTKMLLALPLADCLGPKTLGDILHRLSYGLGMHYIRGKARASVEEVFPVMCQLPAAKDLATSYIKDILLCNAKPFAGSRSIDLEMICLPNAINMSPADIQILLHKSVLRGRVQVVRFLAALMGDVQLDKFKCYEMMRDCAVLGNASTFPLMISDLQPFDIGRCLKVEHVVWCLNAMVSHAEGSTCMLEAAKYFTSLPAAKKMHQQNIGDILINAVSNPRHRCQHNALSEAVSAILSLPFSKHVPQEHQERILLGALHNGCMPCVHAILKRWGKTLDAPYKALGPEHLLKALKGCFEHSRCNPQELIKGVVRHPSASKITTEDLQPVLAMVCSSTPLGRQDCDNDGCGPATATAVEVLKNAPTNPLKQLLKLPAVQGVNAELHAQLINLSYKQLQDKELWTSLLNSSGEEGAHVSASAAAAAKLLSKSTVVDMVAQLVTPTKRESIAAEVRGSRALQTLLKTPSMRKLGPAQLSELISTGVAAGCRDELLAKLVRLPGTQQLKLAELTALLATTAGADYACVSLRLLKLPNAPVGGVFEDFLSDMEQRVKISAPQGGTAPAAAAAAAGKGARGGGGGGGGNEQDGAGDGANDATKSVTASAAPGSKKQKRSAGGGSGNTGARAGGGEQPAPDGAEEGEATPPPPPPPPGRRQPAGGWGMGRGRGGRGAERPAGRQGQRGGRGAAQQQHHNHHHHAGRGARGAAAAAAAGGHRGGRGRGGAGGGRGGWGHNGGAQRGYDRRAPSPDRGRWGDPEPPPPPYYPPPGGWGYGPVPPGRGYYAWGRNERY